MKKINLIIIMVTVALIIAAIIIYYENKPVDNFNAKPIDYMNDGLSIYRDLRTNELTCFGCNNEKCVDILVDENIEILNESAEMYCNNDFTVFRGVKIKSNFGSKIVYDFAQGLSEEDYRNDCAQRGGTFNSCGSVCAPGAQVCASVCGLTCEGLR